LHLSDSGKAEEAMKLLATAIDGQQKLDSAEVTYWRLIDSCM